MTSFDALKKNRSKSLESLNEQLSKISSKTQYSNNTDEETYWKPTRDSAGNGMAIIRFLPAPDKEDMPFVRLWDHGFQGPTGKWYIENSLTTLGQEDPLSEINRKLWNSGLDEDKKTAQKQKRRLHYISNVYIVKDYGNPENDGKVFRYKYGKKIFDKLNDLMNPSFADEKPINPFDLWEGANFRLKIKMADNYPNYDKSEFDSPGPLFESDDKMEEVWKKEYPLSTVVDPKNFKSYDELKTKLYSVLGLVDTGSRTSTSKAEDDLDADLDISKMSKETEAPKLKEKESKNEVSVDDEDDDDLEIFRELAKR